MKWSEVKWSEVAQSCPTLCDPMDCSLSGSSVHGIFQARVLEWIAISFSKNMSNYCLGDVKFSICLALLPFCIATGKSDPERHSSPYLSAERSPDLRVISRGNAFLTSVPFLLLAWVSDGCWLPSLCQIASSPRKLCTTWFLYWLQWSLSLQMTSSLPDSLYATSCAWSQSLGGKSYNQVSQILRITHGSY